MLIRCTTCQTPLDIGPDETAYTKCPACETSLSPETANRDADQPGRFVAHFELRENVGQGTYGSVWKAWDTKLERFVALKLPRLESVDLEKLLKEARSAALIRHPSIVEVFEVGVSPDQPYIATRFVEGTTLEEWLTEHQPDEQKIVELVSQLADAIHTAHELRVIHRDLKPTNILIDADGQPHITDFGVAKREDSDATLHVDGQIIGTPAYMSPEQARGDGSKADRRSDVYSLGAILYRALSGRAPFSGSPRVVIPLVLSQLPDALDEAISEPVRAICDKAMSKSPDDRYPTASAMSADLHKFIDGDAITAVVQPRNVRKRRYAGLIPFVLVVILAVSSVGFLFRESAAEYAFGPFPVPDRDVQDVVLRTSLPMKRLLCYPVRGATCARDKSRPILEQQDIGSDTVHVELEPGRYLVVAEATTGEFHEVFRTVPTSASEPGDFRHNSWKVKLYGRIELPEIRLFSNDEAFHDLLPINVDTPVVNFGQRDATAWNAPHQMHLASYLLSRTEISATAFEEWLQKNGHRPPNANPSPEELMKLTGPAVNVKNDEVDAYLEAIGCRLPTDHEYEFAVTAGAPDAYKPPTPTKMEFSMNYLGSADDVAASGHKFLFSRAAEMTLTPTTGMLGLVVEDPLVDQLPLRAFHRSVRGAHTAYHCNLDDVEPDFITTPLKRDMGLIAPEYVGFRAARSRVPCWEWNWEKGAKIRKDWELYDRHIEVISIETAPQPNEAGGPAPH